MNYSELSDYQINNLVHNIIVCGGKYTLVFSGEHDIQWIDKSDGLVVKTGKQSYGNQLKNYCNSWADAGPIITENQISIIFDADPVIEPPAHWVMCRHVSDKGDITEHYGMPDSPLRAAMIVFLMMQEKK